MGTWKKLAYQDDVITKALLTEQGDIIYASAASTPAALAHGLATQYLKSGGHGANPSWDTPVGGGPTLVLKTADEIVNNSNVLQNDDTLLFPVAALEVWEFTFKLCILQGASVSANFKYALKIPTNATMIQAAISWSVGSAGVLEAAHSVSEESETITIGSGANALVIIHALVGVGDTAGNVQLQWAQGTATAVNTKVKANSCLIANKLA